MRQKAWTHRWLLAAGALFLAFCAAVPVWGSADRLAADEPEYLLTTHSLVTDGDVDLADEYAGRAYAPYHGGDLVAQDAPTADGRRLSPHGIGLPLLLVPGFAAGGWVGARVELALVAALVLVGSGILAERYLGEAGRRRTRWAPLVAVALCGLSAPLWIYSTQVYPELPAAGLLVLAALIWTGRLRGRRPALAGLALGAVVGALVLLGAKYLPLAAAVGVISTVRLRKERRAVVVLATAAAVLVGLQLAWTAATYGGATAYATNRLYAGSATGAMVADNAGGLDRTYRVLALMLDRHFGLARYSLVWVVAAAALFVAALRRTARTEAWWPLVVCVCVQWATATWLALTMRGWWFPGRQVVTVLPLLVPAVAWAWDKAPKLVTVLGVPGLVVGAASVWALDTRLVGAATNPFFLPLPGFGAVGGAYPYFRHITASTVLLSAAWCAAAGVLVHHLWRRSAVEAHDGAGPHPTGESRPETARPPGPDLLVGFPARNEAATVGELVRRAGCLEGHLGSVAVVVVDDGSTDGTATAAEAAGATVLRPPPGHSGLGAAVRTILEHGARTGAAAVAFMDADGEYAPEDLVQMVQLIRAGSADYVTGNRFVVAAPSGMPRWRRIGNRSGSLAVSALVGLRVRDAQSGIRLLSAHAAAAAQVRHDYNYAQVLTIDLCRRGFRLAEVPVSYERRRQGRTFVRLPTYLRRVLPAMLAARFAP